MEKITKNLCCTCKHWNNKQSELQYSEILGICTSVNHKTDSLLFDRVDRFAKDCAIMRVAKFEYQDMDIPEQHVRASRYCFVTKEDFGCIHHSKK